MNIDLHAKDMDTASRHLKPPQAAGKTIKAVHDLPGYSPFRGEDGGTAIEMTDGTWLLVEGGSCREYYKWPWETCVEVGLVTQETMDLRMEQARQESRQREAEKVRRHYDQMLEALRRYGEEHGIIPKEEP